MCFRESERSKKDRQRRSRSGSGHRSSRSRGRRDDRRPSRYDSTTERRGVDRDGYGRGTSGRGTSGRNAYEYPSLSRGTSNSHGYNTNNRRGYRSHDRGGGEYANHRDRNGPETAASRSLRDDTRPRYSGPRTDPQRRHASQQRSRSTDPREREHISHNTYQPTQRSKGRDSSARYPLPPARPSRNPPLPGRQRTQASVPSRFAGPLAVPVTNVASQVSPQQKGEGLPLKGNTANPTTSTGYGLDAESSASSASPTFIGYLEDKHSSAGVTETTRCEGDSDIPDKESWFDQLTKNDQQVARDLVQLDIKRVLGRDEFPYLRSLFKTDSGTGDWFSRLPPEEQTSLAEYKFGSKEAFDQRKRTDDLWRIEDWIKVLPEISHSDLKGVWWMQSRAEAILSRGQQAEVKEREKVDGTPFRKVAHKKCEEEIREAIGKVQEQWDRSRIKTKEWESYLTEGLRRTYGPKRMISQNSGNNDG